MKKILLSCTLLLGYGLIAYSQSNTVTGTVTDATDNSSLPGVSVVIKGTSNGTITDADGRYSISVEGNGILAFSFVGYATKEVSINSNSVINVNLNIDATELSEVVVTALGISREKKSLTYSAEQLDGKQLTQAKDASFINALAGKTAGVQINRSASGVGGSTRVILRGNASAGNNNVLYVIDGVPMINYTSSQPNDVFGQNTLGNGTGGSGRDGGDAISNLNPEDIESITILKGASASALYGSQAANGVIQITTKSGKSGKTAINFSSNYTTESILVKPELQYKYGQTAAGSLDSWGSAVNASNHVDNFFEKANTWINSISLSGGNEKAQTYFSYANTNSSGLLPTSSLKKHNFNFKETAKFLDDKLTVTANTNYIYQEGHNRATSGLYFNPLTGLYQFPRGLDFNEYNENFEVFDGNRNTDVQNWTADKDTQQNPYWILRRNQNDDSRSRININASATYEIKDGLSVRIKGTLDNSHDLYEQKSYASTQGTLADVNGRYVRQRTSGSQKYGEIMLSYNKTWKTLSLATNFGSSINDTRISTEYADSKDAGTGLQFANVFSLQNIAQPGATFSQRDVNSQLQSVFASANLGYQGKLYLDVTARTDYSSTLAFTDDLSFFYPSVGITGLINEMTALPDVIDLFKVRATYAQVGNGVGPKDTFAHHIISNSGVAIPSTIVAPGTSLKPELQTSTEFGVELGLFKRRIGIDFTYYKNSNNDQRIQISAPSSEVGATFYIVNAGEIENKGIELAIKGIPVQSEDFTWDVGVNYTSNKNKVISLSQDLAEGEFFLTNPGVNNYAMVIREGGSFGEIYGQKFERVNGKIVVDATGIPQASSEGLELVGDINPDYMLGISNNLVYKNFSLSFLIDGRFGGEVMSITEAMNDELGVSSATASARDNGSINADVVLADGSAYSGTLDPQTWYTTVGGRAGITENYIYSATNIRLRELSLGYQLPVDNIDFIERAKFSIVGRNLFFFKNDAPFDPDVSLSTGTGLQGIDVYSLPSTRSFGFNLSVTF